MNSWIERRDKRHAAFVCIALLSAAMGSVTPIALRAQHANWKISTTPTLTLGRANGDAADVFTVVAGATMLPGGNIMVADRADYSMRIFSSAGKELKKFGRKGKGPGELTYAAYLLRCGQQVFVYDIDGYGISKFSLDGTFVHKFRFNTKLGANPPYKSACNRDAMFVHYGWDSDKDMKIGLYRAMVPLWVTPADSSVGVSLGKVSGSERWGIPGGAGPLPLGKETRIAISHDKIFVGEANAYEIKVFTIDGKVLPSVAKSVKTVAVTAKDIADDLEREVAQNGEKTRKSTEREYAATTMPKTLPPYRALLVDSEENLWVEDYVHASPTTVTWTVFNSSGKQISELQLPFALEVFEIGKDYVLGRYIDPNEAVPEVRVYKLTK